MIPEQHQMWAQRTKQKSNQKKQTKKSKTSNIGDLPFPSPLGGHMDKVNLSRLSGRHVSSDSDLAHTLCLDFTDSRTIKNKVLLFINFSTCGIYYSKFKTTKVVIHEVTAATVSTI